MMIPEVLPRFANISEAALWAWHILAINVQPMPGQAGMKTLTPYYALAMVGEGRSFTAGFALKLDRNHEVLQSIQPISRTTRSINWLSLGTSYVIPTKPAWVDSFEKLCAWIISLHPNCQANLVSPTLLVLRLQIAKNDLSPAPGLDDSTMIDDEFVFSD